LKIFTKSTLALIMLGSLTAFAGVSVSSPSDGATVGSPVHFVASAGADSGIAAIRVYVDDNSAYLTYSSNFDTNIPIGGGSHYVVVQAWDNSGNVYRQIMTINVSGSSGGSPAPSNSGGPVTVNSPTEGQVLGSPAHFVASSTSPDQYPIAAMQIYVDDQLDYSANTAQLDTSLNLGGGSHRGVVKSWNTAGESFSQTVNFSVGSGGSSPTPAPTPAPTSSGNAGITVSSPTNGGSSASPIHVVASAQAPAGIAAIHIYIDDNDVFQTGAGSVDTNVNAGAGNHSLVVQAWDNNGTVYKQAVSVSVSAGTTTTGNPSSPNQTAPSGNGYYDIDQLPAWDSCNSCAGAGGVGPQVGYSMSEGVNSPSIDGQSVQFWLGGGYPYSGALWWKELTPQPGASHFTYDLYFYYQNADAPQGLEFDVNQVVNGGRYIFGTECNLKQTGTWRVWDTTNAHWVNTGVGCNPSASNWNHMTWELQRNGDGGYTFVAVTLNGVKQSINQTYWSKSASGDELSVAVQLDSNYAGTEYSVWADKIALNYY
jgi:hypothetical protein